MKGQPVFVNKAQMAMLLAYKEAFGSENGQMVLRDLEAFCGSYSHVPGDLYETLRRTYQRDFLIRIHEMVERADGPFELIDEEEK